MTFEDFAKKYFVTDAGYHTLLSDARNRCGRFQAHVQGQYNIFKKLKEEKREYQYKVEPHVLRFKKESQGTWLQRLNRKFR